MKIDKWLYVRNVADEDNDDGDTGSNGVNPTSICFPASAIRAITPKSTTSLIIRLQDQILDNQNALGKRRTYKGDDHVIINVTEGKLFEVMEHISLAISNHQHTDGFIVLADEVTTTYGGATVEAQYLSPYITSVSIITAQTQPQGYGVHEYYEEIYCRVNADADGEVLGSLSIKLPNHCILLEGAISAITLSSQNKGLVALKFHSSALADLADASITGTEWVGADASGNTSIPDTDLDVALTDGTQFDTVHSGTYPPHDTAGNDTHFFLIACEDASGNSGADAKVGVYIKWFGAPAVTIAD